MPAEFVRAHCAPAIRAALAAAFLASPAVAQEGADLDAVAATVNGETITVGEILAIREQLPEQYRQLPPDALYDGIRRQLIDQHLLADAAEAAGVDEEPQIARELELQREGFLAEEFVRRQVEKVVDEEALRQAYEQRIVEAAPVEEVRASHILVDSKEKADELRAEIEAGADFAELAREHGTDGTKEQGGDLGWFTRDVMVAPFAEAAFALQEGQVSEPVQTQFGWHLIRLQERREQPKPSFEEVRGELEQELSNAAAQATLTEAREAAEISIDESRPGLSALAPAATAD